CRVHGPVAVLRTGQRRRLPGEMRHGRERRKNGEGGQDRAQQNARHGDLLGAIIYPTEPDLGRRRLVSGAPMNEWVGRWPGGLVPAEAGLADDFEARLRDSSGLAFSIAYGVLRNRADAEEVAQDAFTRAFGRFGQLRDRERFRAWLTRMTWRLAIDRWRAD